MNPYELLRSRGSELAVYAALVALYVVAAMVVADEQHPVAFELYSRGMLVMLAWTLLVASVAYLLHLTLVRRPDRPLTILREDARMHFRAVERLAIGLPTMMMLSIFMGVFSSWKIMLPELVPFSWDPMLADWDRALHGGTDPWRWLHPVLGHPPITSAINFVYNAWLVVLYTVLLWQTFTLSKPRLRRQFLIAFLLCWSLLGSVLATVMSSAGPCYFGRVTGQDDPFAALTAYLQQANLEFPVWSLRVQEMLWADYLSSTLEAGRGISAMPSMHVSSSLLILLVAWGSDRRLGFAFVVFLAIILVGSVHLAWHYALDGYVALPLTYGLWRLAGWIAARPVFTAAPAAIT